MAEPELVQPEDVGRGPADYLPADAFEGRGSLSGMLLKFDYVPFAEDPSADGYSLVFDTEGNGFITKADQDYASLVDFTTEAIILKTATSPVVQALSAATMKAAGWREADNKMFLWRTDNGELQNANQANISVQDHYVWPQIDYGADVIPDSRKTPPWEQDPYQGNYDIDHTAWIYGVVFKFQEGGNDPIYLLGAVNRWTRFVYFFRWSNISFWHLAEKVLLAALTGMVSGICSGAAIGNVVPGVGTLIGAIIGAIIGIVVGAISGYFDEISNDKDTVGRAIHAQTQHISRLPPGALAGLSLEGPLAGGHMLHQLPQEVRDAVKSTIPPSPSFIKPLLAIGAVLVLLALVHE
jgi:hypothetical protein